MKEQIISNYFFIEDVELCRETLSCQIDYFNEPRGGKKDFLCIGLLVMLQNKSLLVRLNIPCANGNDPDKLWSVAELEDAHLIFDEIMKNQI